MSNSIDVIIKQRRVFSCIDCGKCISSCPLAKAGLAFSPRVIIEKALLGLDFFNDRELWLCLTCNACSEKCPSNVRFNEFVETIRDVAINEGVTEYCFHCQNCGKNFVTTPIMEFIEKSIGKVGLDEEYLMLCYRCRRLKVAHLVHPALTRKAEYRVC